MKQLGCIFDLVVFILSGRMAERFAIAYYYVTPEDKERLDSFREMSGDSEKHLITQYVRGWIGRNRDYYLDLARKDAEARGMDLPSWAKVIVSEGIGGLPNYEKELTDIPPSLLREVVVPPSSVKRPLSYITLGRQNVALLRVGVHFDRDNTIGFISRIVREHIQRNWEKLYSSQVATENFENWS